MTFVCFTEDKEQQILKYYAIGLSISCIFLAVTLCVYACLPKVNLILVKNNDKTIKNQISLIDSFLIYMEKLLFVTLLVY